MKELFNRLWQEANLKKPKNHFKYNVYNYMLILLFIILFLCLIFLCFKFNRVILNTLNVTFLIFCILVVFKYYKSTNFSDKAFASYEYVYNYISFFLENFAKKIFNDLNYDVLKDDGNKTKYAENRTYQDSFFVINGKILGNKFTMECKKDYYVRKKNYNDSFLEKEKITYKKGFYIEIECFNNVKSEIKFVPPGNYQESVRRRYKVENKKINRLFKVYADEQYVYQSMFSGEFADILEKLVIKLNGLRYYMPIRGFYYPNVEITITHDNIRIYVGSAFVFNDLLPIKFKTKYYLKKMIYIRHLCEALIKHFR